MPLAVSFSKDQINLFERKYDNYYDIYDDQMYVAWLQQQHPDDLPVELSLASTSAEDISLVSTSIDEEQAKQPNFTTANPDPNPTDNSITTVTVIDSVIADNDSTQPSANVSHSLSASLANTRRFVTELTELLDEVNLHQRKVTSQNRQLECLQVLSL